MKLKSDSRAQNSPSSEHRLPSGGTFEETVFGFPIKANQFNVLESNQSADSQCQRKEEEVGLVDPRTTRHLRAAASRAEVRGRQAAVQQPATVHYSSDAQGMSGTCVEPVTSESCSSLFVDDSFSASPVDILSLQSAGPVHYTLGTGDIVGDAMYENDVNDVACTVENCNKRISYAGPERSAGRPGHTPIRRDLACEKTIEDSCAGQDWSAGRPGNRPFGASTAACPSHITACIGPYGTASTQLHHTGCNTREETSILASSTSGLPRQEDISTSQPETSSSGRHAAEDRASPAKVVLQPRRPPYFCGGLDEDVHVWTSIVDRWLGTIRGEPSMQLTFIVSLLRGVAYDWYQYYETRTGCPGDWTTLRRAMLERFGTSIRVEKARAGLYQLKQDKMTVLQYAAAFESFLAQLGDYDESYYLVHFIFGLRPEIMRGVYIQQPDSLLAAKNMAERLELTHHLTVGHPMRTKKQKTSKTQHRGTQERRSSGHNQQKTHRPVQRQRQRRTTVSAQYRGCVSARTGAFVEASCPEVHGPAAVWRSRLKDLPQGDRAGRVRRQGSVVTVSLEALAHEKEKTSADATEAKMCTHLSSGGLKAPRVYLRNRLLRRDRERKARDRARERQLVTGLLETLVSPSSGGTESCQGVTTDDLQGWQSTGLHEANIGSSTVREMPQTQLCAVSYEDQPRNPRSQEDGILMVVPVRIFGQEVRALIDSGATRCFISPAGVTRCGLAVESHHTFLELGDGKKVLSRGRAVDVPVVTSGYAVKINLTVSRLLHGVDVVLGLTWLRVADPIIRWSTGQIYIPDSISSFQRVMGQWMDKQVKTGTVKVLSTNEDLESLKQPSETASLEILKNPQFWARRTTDTQNSWRSSRGPGGNTLAGKFFELVHPSFGVLRVQRLNNNAALPKRGTEGAAGYDLCAAQSCTIPAGGKGLVKTGISIQFPTGLYARIAPRSGLALKKFIDVGAGVVDADYRGEVGVVLFNHGDQDFEVKMGDRIAQLILEKISTPAVEEVSGLDDTVRGSGGFGSTGIESKNDTGTQIGEKEMKMKKERTVEKNMVKNETLTGSTSGKNRTDVKKTKTEVSSRLSRERQIISVKRLKKLVKKKTPVFLAVVWGQETRKVNAAVRPESIGLTEGKKRDLMKKTGPKKKFLSVEEREAQILERVDPGVRGKLKELVDEFKDVFPDTLPKGRPPKRDIVHEIRTEEGAKPPSRPPYRLSPSEQDEMEEQVKDLLAQGFIRPSASPYGAPILFVPKKDGRWRMCIDYRALNKQTVKDQFPLPRIDSLLERLGQATVFTKLDLASGYHQIAMEESSIQKTAFRTNRGHFEFFVMPFGLCNAPATFQRLMNKVFADNLGQFITVYLDDILIFSRTMEEHWQHLRWALSRLREAKLYGRLHKCEFLKDQVDYLGFEVSPHGIQASPEKVRAIIEWPKPKGVHDVRSFLGLASYYRRFVRGFSEMARPLTALTRAGVDWEWSIPQHQAFNRLKLALTTAPVLKAPGFWPAVCGHH